MTVRQQDLLDEVPPDPDLLPVFLSGTVTLGREANGEEIVVAAVDGVVGAVTAFSSRTGLRLGSRS